MIRTVSIITFTVASAAITGCKQEVSHQLFARESEVKDMDRFAAAQSAAGARQDGMLYSHHFAGTELNSLGRSKLHLMATDKATTEPLAVYLNTNNDPLSTERQAAISKYLHEHGLAIADIHVKTGPNPSATYPASAGLIRYSKTESGSPEGTVNSSGTNTGTVSNTSGAAK